MVSLRTNPVLQKICIIIPCYNEADRLPADKISAFLQNHSHIRIIGVDDGSTDRTIEVLKLLNLDFQKQFSIIEMPKNSGKAEAVRTGIQKAASDADSDYIGFWDADLSTPLDELNWFCAFSGGQLHHDIIMGSRTSRLGSNIDRNMMRHYLGRVFATFTSVILRLKVYDTQCGAKLFKREIVGNLFVDPFKSAWFFDVELLARYIRNNGHNSTYEKVLEVPLRQWVEVKGSKLKLLDFLRVPLELIKIKRHYKL